MGRRESPRPLGSGDHALLLLFFLLALAIHLPLIGRYGFFRDEFYYIACSENLAWGYVDHPPLSIALLWLSRQIAGDSILAIRLLPVLAGAVGVFLTGWMCRRMGGGGFAQANAMSAWILSPYFLFVHHIYSMNGFEVLVWSSAAAILIHIVDHERPKHWWLLGLVLGLGLLNKISVLWFGLGLTLGLVLTGRRRWLRTRWPWLAVCLAGLIFMPHLVWQAAHGWPTLEFLRNAVLLKMVATSPLDFLLQQVLTMNPFLAPVWLAGLIYLFLVKDGRPYRLLGIVFLSVLLLLMVSGTSRPGYLAPAYPMLLAAGGVWLERVLTRVRWGWAKPVGLTFMVAGGLTVVPTGLPILPVDTYVRYADALGMQVSSQERSRLGRLPQHYADMFGWDELVDVLSEVYHTIPLRDRDQAGIFTRNYGEAGAIDFLGRREGLPRAISGHNNYWFWGPRGYTGEVMLLLGGSEEAYRELFEEVEQVAATRCDYCMPYENDVPIYLARRLRPTLDAIWPGLMHFE